MHKERKSSSTKIIFVRKLKTFTTSEHRQTPPNATTQKKRLFSQYDCLLLLTNLPSIQARGTRKRKGPSPHNTLHPPAVLPKIIYSWDTLRHWFTAKPKYCTHFKAEKHHSTSSRHSKFYTFLGRRLNCRTLSRWPYTENTKSDQPSPGPEMHVFLRFFFRNTRSLRCT